MFQIGKDGSRSQPWRGPSSVLVVCLYPYRRVTHHMDLQAQLALMGRHWDTPTPTHTQRVTHLTPRREASCRPLQVTQCTLGTCRTQGTGVLGGGHPGEPQERALSMGNLQSCYGLSHFSRVRLFVTPWTAACQAPLFMGFSRQEHWSGLPFPSPELTFIWGKMRTAA